MPERRQAPNERTTLTGAPPTGAEHGTDETKRGRHAGTTAGADGEPGGEPGRERLTGPGGGILQDVSGSDSDASEMDPLELERSGSQNG